MYKDGLHTLAPTAFLLKQAPHAAATVNTTTFPAEISLTLRHLPHPAHFAKSCSRSHGSTYIAYLINNRLHTKTCLGTIEKLRPGTFQLITGAIPFGNWDQLVISLSDEKTATLGLPLFTLSYNFTNPAPQECPPPPLANFHPSTVCQAPPETLAPEPEEKYREKPNPALAVQEPVFPEAEAPQTPSAILDSPSEDLLLQPGIPLPEDISTAPCGAKPAAPTEPNRKPSPPLTDQALCPLKIDQLPHHQLWLINYEGRQLVGYVYHPAQPRKPLFIVHGVPGANSRQAKPPDRGYDYWIADPHGKEGFWLRYISPYDNQIAHPYPVK